MLIDELKAEICKQLLAPTDDPSSSMDEIGARLVNSVDSLIVARINDASCSSRSATLDPFTSCGS